MKGRRKLRNMCLYFRVWYILTKHMYGTDKKKKIHVQNVTQKPTRVCKHLTGLVAGRNESRK